MELLYLLAQAKQDVPPELGIGIIVCWCFGIIVSLLLLAFMIWMLVDAINNPALAEGNQRLIWILIILLVPCGIGAIVYYFGPRKKAQG